MKKVLLNLLLVIASAYASMASAIPVVGSYNPSQSVIRQSGNKLIIDQRTPTGLYKWKSFNIKHGEQTIFNQPSKSSVAINRVDSANGVSKIYGSLISNGKIVLINQAGIYFGPSAFVSVAGLIASTSDMSRIDSKGQRFVFDKPSPYANAAIVNKGTIKAADYGLVALIGRNVENTGTITAHAGNVVLASGNKFTLDFVGDQLLNFSIDEAAGDGNVANSVEDMGAVNVTPSATQKILDSSINTKGIPEATSFAQTSNGDLIFSAGSIKVAGKIDVSGRSAKQKGGKVKILAKNIEADNLYIDASGNDGGGEVLIGGNAHGGGTEFHADTVNVGKNTLIEANALENGDGGKVVAWSDVITTFDGKVYAQGGPAGGNGGFVETSGKLLQVGDNTLVNTLAPKGKIGKWLLDPADVTIVAGGVDTNATYNPGFPGTYTFTGALPTIGADNLGNNLNLSDVTIDANTSGVDGISRITVNADPGSTWTSNSRLTLTADTVQINSNITNSSGDLTVDGPAIVGNVTLQLRDLDFNSTLNGAVPGANTLVLNLSSDNSSIFGAVGGTSPLNAISLQQGFLEFYSNTINIVSGLQGAAGPVIKVVSFFGGGPHTITLSSAASGQGGSGVISGFSSNLSFSNIFQMLMSNTTLDLGSIDAASPKVVYVFTDAASLPVVPPIQGYGVALLDTVPTTDPLGDFFNVPFLLGGATYINQSAANPGQIMLNYADTSKVNTLTFSKPSGVLQGSYSDPLVFYPKNNASVYKGFTYGTSAYNIVFGSGISSYLVSQSGNLIVFNIDGINVNFYDFIMSNFSGYGTADTTAIISSNSCAQQQQAVSQTTTNTTTQAVTQEIVNTQSVIENALSNTPVSRENASGGCGGGGKI